MTKKPLISLLNSLKAGNQVCGDRFARTAPTAKTLPLPQEFLRGRFCGFPFELSARFGPRRRFRRKSRREFLGAGSERRHNALFRAQEEQMAKGQMKSNKEGKKPKSEKPKSEGSAYKKAQGKGGAPISVPGKKG